MPNGLAHAAELTGAITRSVFEKAYSDIHDFRFSSFHLLFGECGQICTATY
jgi:hypothetical protein